MPTTRAEFNTYPSTRCERLHQMPIRMHVWALLICLQLHIPNGRRALVTLEMSASEMDL